mgnify:CR=1 FL=1
MVALSARDVEMSVGVASIESERSFRGCLASVSASVSGPGAAVDGVGGHGGGLTMSGSDLARLRSIGLSPKSSSLPRTRV